MSFLEVPAYPKPLIRVELLTLTAVTASSNHSGCLVLSNHSPSGCLGSVERALCGHVKQLKGSSLAVISMYGYISMAIYGWIDFYGYGYGYGYLSSAARLKCNEKVHLYAKYLYIYFLSKLNPRDSSLSMPRFSSNFFLTCYSQFYYIQIYQIHS